MTMLTIANAHSRPFGALRAQWRVIFALMLRDLRARYFGHGLGYLIVIAWPIAHIAVLMLLYSSAGRAAPYGSSVMVFLATGLIPFMTFNYMSRFTQFAMVLNRPLLGFPAVRVLDILLAHGLLEVLASCLMTAFFVAVLWLAGADVVPRNILQAAFAFGAAMLLGFGFGMISGIITLGMPYWMTGYALLVIVLWLTSGILFVPDALPENFRRIIALNPILHGVEWMRSAYYDGYGSQILDKGYLLAWGVGTVLIGLVAERFARGHLLQG
jgi:capsular polysaccharide transport system permease protein